MRIPENHSTNTPQNRITALVDKLSEKVSRIRTKLSDDKESINDTTNAIIIAKTDIQQLDHYMNTFMDKKISTMALLKTLLIVLITFMLIIYIF